MGDTNINYDEKFGFNTFQREICAELGEKFWKELTDGLTLPDMESECSCQCRNMYLFMERLLSEKGISCTAWHSHVI